MKAEKKTYRFFHRVSAIVMMVALIWLTVSAPFAAAAALLQADQNETSSNVPVSCNEEEAATPLSNATEEKAPSGNSFSEEYLHGHEKGEQFLGMTDFDHGFHSADTYNAFHGEVQVPPPNVI